MAKYRSISYMFANLGSKSLAAIVQLFAIFVLTKMHSQEEAALVFLLLGYAIWFQSFEFGLAQTLQNKFNTKVISADEMQLIIVFHFVLMLAIGCFVVLTPFLADTLLPSNKNALEIQAFSVGSAILLIASNNLISQRFLIVLNKGQTGNALILIQSFLSLLGLTFYQYRGHNDLLAAVCLYLGPQILVSVPMFLGWSFKLFRNASKVDVNKLGPIINDAISFWGIGVFAALFLGSDYYFAAHYMNSQQIVSYHLATRIFFISYVAYYAYVQHCARRLSIRALNSNDGVVQSIFKESVIIGFIIVFSVYGLSAGLDSLGFFSRITNGVGIGQSMLFSAFLYFTIRVCLDISMVLMLGLNAKAIMYKVYVLEVLVGMGLMSIVVPKYGGQGLFISLSVACILGLGLLIQECKKVSPTFSISY